MNLLDDAMNQASKIRARHWVEINDEPKGRYDNSNIRFKTSMIRSNLCNYSDRCIPVTGAITVPNMGAAAAAVHNTNKNLFVKNCAPFTDCITEINNTQADDAPKDWYSNAYVYFNRVSWCLSEGIRKFMTIL